MPVPEISNPTPECPEPGRWSMFDLNTAEVEVLDFLYQLTKTLKPELVVETGTHKGISSCYIGKALKELGRGKLITCELDPKLHAQAKALVNRCGYGDSVEVCRQSSLEMAIDQPIDILFSDSDLGIRMQEVERFWPQLKPTSVILIHDCNTDIHKSLRQQIIEADKDRKLSVVLLPTPRGLAICQKREGRG